MFGPEALKEYANADDYIKRRGTALGVDTKGLVRTAEQIEQSRQQQQMQAMIQQFGPEVIKQMGNQNQQPPQPQ